MKTFVVDCSTVTSEMELWEKFIEVTNRDGVESFGYNLAAFDDAITGGGPGWPGKCEMHFINTSHIQKFRNGEFYKHLERIASESTSAHIYLETRIVTKKAWWKIW